MNHDHDTATGIYNALERSCVGFTVTADHLKLLKHANITWRGDENGAPALDPRRPYGSSNLEDSVASIVVDGYNTWGIDRQDTYLKAYGIAMRNLHAEAGIALQICLRYGLHTGDYARETWYHPWKPVNDQPTPPVTPEHLDEIRERDDRATRRAEDPACSLDTAEADRMYLLSLVDWLIARRA